MTHLDQLDLTGLRVLDGAMATELELRGCDISGPLWSAQVLADSPATIEAVHDSYLEAGSDCILTASYQVSFEGYRELGLAPETAAEALRQSVRLAEASRLRYRLRSARPIWIAASLGPYGASLHNGAEYHGNYGCSFDALVSFHVDRLAVLAGTNADLAAFETIPSIEEARAILVALRQFPTIAAWLSFTCRDDLHLAHGEPLADCGALLQPEPQVLAAGINCTAPEFAPALIRSLRQTFIRPIVAYPNSGELWDAEQRRWHGQSSINEYGDLASKWAEAGANWIGGCCRTGPQHIHAVRDALGQESKN